MSARALMLESFQGEVDPAAAAERTLRLRVERAALRLSETAVQALLPPGTPLELQRLRPGVASFRHSLGTVEARPVISPSGALLIEVTGVRAAGILPVPLPFVHAAIRQALPTRPGLRLGPGGNPEIELRELLGPLGVELPPLRSAQALDGELRLEW
ncbi:MAG: hypothetical protein ACK47B_22135 [Armatimonadota bacterium]